MNPRVRDRKFALLHEYKPLKFSETFGMDVFNRKVMHKMLSKEVYKHVVKSMDGRTKIKSEYLDAIANAMKEWAVSLGATHYNHWFQPLTGASAEKCDAFFDWNSPDQVIEKFNGKLLSQGEPDASSFPSGGLRSTYEARGYTGWDPTSPAFIWRGGNGVTLCIPSVFFSWTGAPLDCKIPLLRSDQKLNDAVMRMLKLSGLSANYINSTLGCEQEYFVVDRALRDLRPDLLMIGRTVFGAPAPKRQELQDHYFASVQERTLCFMQDFEAAAIRLAIPVKTRHNEVAPAQHEVAPIFEKSSVAVDHNILLMEIMRETATRHGLACLLHEKPFDGINGSGKHCNWSIMTDTGINLLNPTDSPGNCLHFVILMTAILAAVHEHSLLLRASIGSAANDCRLGGHEAPPAIISVYLGEELEKVLQNIEECGTHLDSSVKGFFDLGLSMMPELTKDNTDRNRTSPLAFTGNKFEFRAVGASSSPSFPMTVLNAIIAESLNGILDQVDVCLRGNKQPTINEVIDVLMPIISKSLKISRDIRFSGDNYSEEWKNEAKKRQLPNVKKAAKAFNVIKDKRTVEAFTDILTKDELASRCDIFTEHYVHTIHIEAKLMIEMFLTQILPAAIKYQKTMASSILDCMKVLGDKKEGMLNEQVSCLKTLGEGIENAIKHCHLLEAACKQADRRTCLSEKGESFSEEVSEAMNAFRHFVDNLETIVDDEVWPLPKYRELLFKV